MIEYESNLVSVPSKVRTGRRFPVQVEELVQRRIDNLRSNRNTIPPHKVGQKSVSADYGEFRSIKKLDGTRCLECASTVDSRRSAARHLNPAGLMRWTSAQQ